MGLVLQPPALVALALALSAPPLAAQATSSRLIQCGSTSATDVKCATGGRVVRVSLVRDLAIRSCSRPQAWGFTADYVWTNKCRGEFMVTYGPAAAPLPVQPAPAPAAPDTTRRGDTRRITCGTTTGAQRQCNTGGPAAEVRLVRELSRGRCRKGTTWGHTETLVWAHSGCRAEFEVVYRRTGPERAVRPVVRVMSCGAGENERVECETGGKVTSVRLLRERGRGRCREGSSWGYYGSVVWTSGNCRGDFEVTSRAGAPTPE
jgi:hypothetical protein